MFQHFEGSLQAVHHMNHKLVLAWVHLFLLHLPYSEHILWSVRITYFHFFILKCILIDVKSTLHYITAVWYAIAKFTCTQFSDNTQGQLSVSEIRISGGKKKKITSIYHHLIQPKMMLDVWGQLSTRVFLKYHSCSQFTCSFLLFKIHTMKPSSKDSNP